MDPAQSADATHDLAHADARALVNPSMPPMDWRKLILPIDQRDEIEGFRPHEDIRSRFERDYDRLIFSAAFRRLQDKTQVYPLPGFAQVHNRLTHTLEVSSVGRTIGKWLGKFLEDANTPLDFPEAYASAQSPSVGQDLASIVASACLAHDMGNPPFGHFGEKAISEFFAIGTGAELLQDDSLSLSEVHYADLRTFDGNANALRLLARPLPGKRPYGFLLSYPTLASIIKYPYDSRYAQAIHPDKSKMGFFASEHGMVAQMAERLGLQDRSTELGTRYSRHPLVYLVELADDVCNTVTDLQDGFHLRLINNKEVEHVYYEIIRATKPHAVDRTRRALRRLDPSEAGERINFLRGIVLNELAMLAFENFTENLDVQMAQGWLPIENLLEIAVKGNKTLQTVFAHIEDIKKAALYRETKVIQLELAGNRILSTLLEYFCTATLKHHKGQRMTISERHLYDLLPHFHQVDAKTGANPLQEDNVYYEALFSVIDYITNMTDAFALDLFRKITGSKIPEFG